MEEATLQWAETAVDDNNLTTVGYSDDGLIPSNININADDMMVALCNYIDDNSYTIPAESTKKLQDKLSKTYSFPREDDDDKIYRITDEGRFTNKYDIFNVSSIYKYGLDIIKKEYTKFSISISFDAIEVDSGYKYCFLYNKYLNNDSYLVGSTPKFGDISSSKWVTKELIFTDTSGSEYFDISKLNNDMYILYGASGKYDDDWKNKNVSLCITLYK